MRNITDPASRRRKGLWLSATMALLTAMACVAMLTSCGCGSSSAANTTAGSGSDSGSDVQPPSTGVVPTFDGARALALVQAQCAFGPRVPGSQAHSETLTWLVEQLKPLSNRVYVQSFTATTPMGGPYNFANVMAWLGPADSAGGTPPFLLVSHWDCRPVADEDPDPANRTKPVMGADDGASGVAVMLELARLASETPLPRPVVLAFVDAEDSGKPGSTLPYEGFCIGTVYMADHWPAGWTKPEEGALLDMVGSDGKPDPRIPARTDIPQTIPFTLGLEQNSLEANPALLNQIWTTAEELGHTAFVRQPVGDIIDDHVPLIKAGIKMVDIIHVFPVVWHTIDDTPDRISAASLEQVGDTLAHVLWATN